MAHFYPNPDKKPSSPVPLVQLSSASSWSSSLLLSLNYPDSLSPADYSSIGLLGACSLKATMILIPPKLLHFGPLCTLLLSPIPSWDLIISWLSLGLLTVIGDSLSLALSYLFPLWSVVASSSPN